MSHPIYQECLTCDGVGCGCPTCGNKGKILLGFVSPRVMKAWEDQLLTRDELNQAIEDEAKADRARERAKEPKP